MLSDQQRKKLPRVLHAKHPVFEKSAQAGAGIVLTRDTLLTPWLFKAENAREKGAFHLQKRRKEGKECNLLLYHILYQQGCVRSKLKDKQ
jgi:hypothetical protein